MSRRRLHLSTSGCVDEPPSVLMELPLKSPDIYLEPVYMYFSTFHWHTLVNGYSGFSPPSVRPPARPRAEIP